MNEDQEKEILDLLERMKDLLIRKGHDYSGTEDTLANFSQLEDIGIPAHKSVFIRLTDKHQRIKNFLRQGEFKVSDESAEDTCLDLANYSLLMILAIRKAKGYVDEQTHGPGRRKGPIKSPASVDEAKAKTPRAAGSSKGGDYIRPPVSKAKKCRICGEKKEDVRYGRCQECKDNSLGAQKKAKGRGAKRPARQIEEDEGPPEDDAPAPPRKGGRPKKERPENQCKRCEGTADLNDEGYCEDCAAVIGLRVKQKPETLEDEISEFVKALREQGVPSTEISKEIKKKFG